MSSSGPSASGREHRLVWLPVSLCLYVKSSEEGILNVVADVLRSVSCVFDGNVSGGKMPWTIGMLHKLFTRSVSRGSHLLGFEFVHAKHEQQGFMG